MFVCLVQFRPYTLASFSDSDPTLAVLCFREKLENRQNKKKEEKKRFKSKSMS